MLRSPTVNVTFSIHVFWKSDELVDILNESACDQDLLDIVQDLVTRNVTSHEKAYYERVVTDRDNVEI